MIELTNTLPPLGEINAEAVKIHCLYDCYKDDSDVLFWVQNKNGAQIAMLDGNMIIFNHSAEIEELREFVEVISPACIFSDYETLLSLYRCPPERINVMCRPCDIGGETLGDELTSDALYELLNTDGLSLPDYPHFAVDYCRRLNRGSADYFGLRERCAAITFNSGKLAVINGIASHERGFGSVALKAVIQKNYGRTLLVCCRDSVKGFYEKNGFKHLYYAGYWVKNI